jgi:hypothetical protein
LTDGAREDRKLTEGLRVSPVHVLDNHEKRLSARGSVNEARKRELLAARAGGGVHRLVEPARLIGLRRLDVEAPVSDVWQFIEDHRLPVEVAGGRSSIEDVELGDGPFDGGDCASDGARSPHRAAARLGFFDCPPKPR